jgi:hypothetical protein
LKWEAAHPELSLVNANLPVPFEISAGDKVKIYFKVTDADHAIKDVVSLPGIFYVLVLSSRTRILVVMG